MTFGLESARPPGRAIYQLIFEAKDNDRNDRRAERVPFFRPVSIWTPDGHNYSAFSRDISPIGIGLLHDVELALAEFEITISSEQGYSVCVQTRIVWCRPCGNNWYVSGGEFAGIASVGL